MHAVSFTSSIQYMAFVLASDLYYYTWVNIQHFSHMTTLFHIIVFNIIIIIIWNFRIIPRKHTYLYFLATN